ncbi:MULTISPECIES: 30S ribosomal protein S15 [Treponema]|uniref:Small ribosomal subunit protein uS15 n=6 Tax=Treponema TaxID=157 RepID=RS15_TREPA|nr:MULTISPECIES: 30S ribosomal protein S15 [Treponema]B2S4C4.1 RecName: Full=Small ribosomal subunit protein uS15; AltName: Full=30S ribosomal protein S15 [Treponema pallidum subsp. pallidum SS14]O83857.1 RecName: Full=Small ribosomal subunit protein uS15; AltName: Full=30S ribosomal protein S15 [Treponema pallidum subsp. pallidum str. Nichols]AAC26577.1 ribosomal protein S15 (rpsO) [Treponema pallidum subsp. pallidum str. Nichols]ACD71303.1 ribosomal protein S15 [Treponema pallidum subsp. pall
MALTKERTASVVQQYGSGEKDTGSSSVQIALLTERIRQLTDHCKVHPKDKSSNRGLLVLVGRRRRLLRYSRRVSMGAYRSLVKSLGLRK